MTENRRVRSTPIPRTSRLDQPKEARRSIRLTPDQEQLGRLSERVARFLGSWRFIGYMSIFVSAWVLWNVLAPENLRFDPWPFLALTLMLSLQASYAAPLILLAQNRQADRDRVQFQEDRAATERLIADAEYLARELASLRLAMGEVATREFIRSEFSELAESLSLDITEPTPEDSKKSGKARKPSKRS